jgi:hypothetical protein
MSVGALGAVASAGSALDPAPNLSRAAADAPPVPPPAVTSTATATAPPFLNPAIGDIAARAANSPTDHVLYGDSGLLIQAYGAVALLTGPLNASPIYNAPVVPVIPPVARVAPYPRTPRIDESV